MLTAVLFAAGLLSILGILLGKAGIIYLMRPGPAATYVRCAVLEWAAFALSVIGSLLVILVNVTAAVHEALRRAACMVVIAGSELIAALLVFGVVSLLAGVIVLAVAWRPHLVRAVLAALFANFTMTGVLLVTTVLLISPAPFLTVWQSPVERARRSMACYPPRPAVSPLLPGRSGTKPSAVAERELASAAEHAVTYLHGQYDAQVGLLRESPSVAAHKYWLATDNLLAWYALRAAEQVTLTTQLDAAFAEHGRPTHGLVEILEGQIVAWPPNVATQAVVARCGAAEIWLETRTDGARYQDWVEYADLALYGVLLSRNGGQYTEARRQYQDAMRLFDGVGFDDRAFRVDGVYATYKLALAILAGQAVDEPADPRLWNALLSKQAGVATPTAYVGGFYALYDRQGQPLNDPNTETTSLALLALHVLAR